VSKICSAGVLLMVMFVSAMVAAEPETDDPAPLPRSAADSPAVAELESVLREPTRIDLHEVSLADAVDRIGKQHAINIWLDQRALGDVAIDSSAPVTFHNHKAIPLASALRRIFDDFEMTFVIQDAGLMITSKEKAAKTLSTRVYRIDHLVETGRRQKQSVSDLIQTIEETICPDSWDTNSGGPGAIRPVLLPNGVSLVVANTLDAHRQIAILFADLARPVEGVIDGDDPFNPEPPAANRKNAPSRPYAVIYDLGATSGPEMSKAITEAIAPETWKVRGGVGTISIAPTSIAKDVGSTSVPRLVTLQEWKLIVFQSDDVHQQIEELLTPRGSTFGRPTMAR